MSDTIACEKLLQRLCTQIVPRKCKFFEIGEKYSKFKLKLRLEGHIKFKDASKSLKIMISQ